MNNDIIQKFLELLVNNCFGENISKILQRIINVNQNIVLVKIWLRVL